MSSPLADAGLALVGYLVASSERETQVLNAAREVVSVMNGDRKTLAEKIRTVATKLGGLCVKLVQQTARPEIMTCPIILEESKKCQDECKARPLENIQAQLRAEGFGDAIIEGVLKAGTTAEASKVRVGEKVFLVKTVNVENLRLYLADLQMLGDEGSVLGFFKKIMILIGQGEILEKVLESLRSEEFKEFVLGEFDMKSEAKTMERFRATYRRRGDELRVPRVIRSSPHVLLEEFVQGETLGKWLKSAREDQVKAETPRIFRVLVRSFFIDLTKEGEAHGDPHPGNVMITECCDITMIDLGCHIEVPDAKKERLRSLLQFTGTPGMDESQLQLLKSNLQDLGAEQRSGAELSGMLPWQCVAKSFDLQEACNGLNLKENFDQTVGIKLSGWLLRLQKAFGALAISLQELRGPNMSL
ncbi:unnamed protein product [Symbiodinium sp. CCMP2592]|nr:unnamed protein product [Symbiodinium sp. CCMP2592]CAE7267004.1 unnamed protein product [Symbiodinium sp. CCMP2592]